MIMAVKQQAKLFVPLSTGALPFLLFNLHLTKIVIKALENLHCIMSNLLIIYGHAFQIWVTQAGLLMDK